jgi:hypothetical protein
MRLPSWLRVSLLTALLILAAGSVLFPGWKCDVRMGSTTQRGLDLGPAPIFDPPRSTSIPYDTPGVGRRYAELSNVRPDWGVMGLRVLVLGGFAAGILFRTRSPAPRRNIEADGP